MLEHTHQQFPPDVDLDELTRGLRKVAAQAAPALSADEQGSVLANTHVGVMHPQNSQTDPTVETALPISNDVVEDIAPPIQAPTVDGPAEEPSLSNVHAKVEGLNSEVAKSVLHGVASQSSGSLSAGDAPLTGPAQLDGPMDGAVLASAHSAEELVRHTAATVEQNEAPTDIVVDGGIVLENAAAGTVVAALKAVDPNSGESFTFSLDADPSGQFEIVGNEVRVRVGATLDYESASSHDLVVTVRDSGGLTHTETLKITVTNQNEAPVDITVTGGTVQENSAGGTVVATLGVVDPDASGSFTYSLDADPSGQFEIVGSEVRVKPGASLDYETATSHDLVVTVTDEGGLTRTEVLKIAVANQSGSFVGTNRADTLNGTSEEDVIDGGAGNDRLNGGAGNDTLLGGAGNDTLDGGAGDDAMLGGIGNDTYVVNAAGDVVTELTGEGTDVVQSSVSHTLSANVENLTLTGSAMIDGAGNELNNTLTGNAADNVLDGGAGNDRLNGGAGNDTLLGGAGNDTLDGGAGDDAMLGGIGNDTYVVNAAGDVVTELTGEGTDVVQSSVSHTLSANVENLTLTGSAMIDGAGNELNNTLTGNAADNVLDGGAGNDRLNGGAGNDTLLGGAGNDTLDGGAGDDAMLGGIGNDTYVVNAAGDVVTELTGEGTDVVQSSVSHTLSANVENLTLTGSAMIDGAGNELNNTLTGNAADNVLDGGAGNDRLNGGAGNDTLLGGAGNDTLDGGAGDDAMLGGIGNDTYVVNAAGDVVTELTGEGTDVVQSSVSHTLSANVENLTLTGSAMIDGAGNELNNTLTGNAADNVLDGGAGNDRLNGGAGNDTLLGGAGNDTLDGGAGDDAMLGGIGNDTYVVNAAGDVVTELTGEGTDVVQSSVSHTLSANVENLTLTGSAMIDGAGNELNNTLTGNAADNVLDGGAGNDRLNGGAGNDTLLGGAGNDTLDGGAGDDAMLGGIGNDVLVGGAGNDLFVYMSGQGSDAVNGGSGSWTDTIALDGSAGSLELGTDWTLTLRSGTIVNQNAGELILSANADGFIAFADGARMDFVDIERIQW